jgi:hypothetical protein
MNEPALPPGMQALMDRVDAGGDLRLPSLTREELLALGSAAHPLIDAAEARWLAELSDDDRSSAAAAGARSLHERGLLGRDDGRLMTKPEVQVLVALRRSPALVMIAADDSAASPAIRMYTAAHRSGEIEAVLAERVTPQGHAFLLCDPGTAVKELAAWAIAPPSKDSISGALQTATGSERTVDVYHPSPDASLSYRVAIITSATGEITIREGSVGDELSLPMKVTLPSLEEAIRRAMTPLRPPGTRG